MINKDGKPYGLIGDIGRTGIGIIGGSLLSAALQAIFGIGSTLAANKYNTPRAMRNRLKKAGLPLAYMYQGKVMGQSEVPKLSIDPTLGIAQQRRLEQDAPLVKQQTKLTKLNAEDLALDMQAKDQLSGKLRVDDFGNEYQESKRWELLSAQIDEKRAAAFLKNNQARLQGLTADVYEILKDEGIPQEIKRQELERIKQQIINLTKQAGLMEQLQKIRGLDEWMSTRLQDMKELPDWMQFVVAFVSKLFKPLNIN